jgi:hypothetical protein
VNPTYPQMYNMPNMGMMNSNSMMNYTYLNSNYPNYHSQPQQGYNAYIQTNPTNKFSSNQIYSPQTQIPNQMYNNIYQNKMTNQMPINVPGQTIPINSQPLMNNMVLKSNLSATASPSISTLSQTSLPIQKETNLSNTSVSTASSHIKKSINLEAQSFIPKNLKRQSTSTEKDLQEHTPKKEATDAQKESISESPEKEIKSNYKKETETKIDNNDKITDKELPSPILTMQLKTPTSKKNEEDKKEKTPIKDIETNQSPDNFSLDKKEAVISTEEKPAPLTNTNIIQEIIKPKPKTLLGSILSQPLINNTDSKPAEKTIINPIPVAAPGKKKQNDVSKAFEEKAKDFIEQEKLKKELKKEEKMREEIKQKQASATNTPTSRKKSGKELSKKADKKQTQEETEEKLNEIQKVNEDSKAIQENFSKEKDEKENYLNPIKINEQEKATERKFKIEKIYFRVYEDEKSEDIKNRYAYEYLFSHRNWKICYETKLVEDLMTGHFKNLKETVEEVSANRQQGRSGGNENKGGFGKRGTKFRDEPIAPKINNENTIFQRSKFEFNKQPEPIKETSSIETGEGLGKWGRKDLSKEEKLASEFKTNREEQIKKDPIRFKLTEYLFFLYNFLI